MSGIPSAPASRRNALQSPANRGIRGSKINKGWQRFSHASGNISKRLWRGKVNEGRKVAFRKSLKHALPRCLIHLLPVSVTTVIAYFNLAGYFIGSDLPALRSLSLQVTAKLQVVIYRLELPHALTGSRNY